MRMSRTLVSCITTSIVLAVWAVPVEADTHFVLTGQSIQAAINMAVNGDAIEVSPGTYYESIDFTGKAIRLYSIGGPEGTTINGGGSYHVVQCVSGETADTVLDGFTITGGNANDSFGVFVDGGGMYNNNGNPTVTHCIFTGNTASNAGGGMFNSNSNPTVINCIFNGNTSNNSFGGGMYNQNSSPIVTQCIFSGNSTNFNGGGMSNNNSSPTVTHCTFSGNQAGLHGGGIFNVSSSIVPIIPIVMDCTFSDNHANRDAGGMYNGIFSNPTVANCAFSGNTAGRDGGAMYNLGFSAPKSNLPAIINCSFTQNSAAQNGGGIYNAYSDPTVTNCIFSGNTATTNGGGMHNIYSNHSTITNCTFTGNKASQSGGGVCNEGGDHTISNCIFWGDTPGEIFNSSGIVTITYSNVMGGGSTWQGEGNIERDPMFVNAAHGDFTLSACSPCVDAANNVAVPPEITTDLAGNPRFVDDEGIDDRGTGTPPIVDMGAYERQAGTSAWSIYNQTQKTGYCRIQWAIDAAVNGDMIEVLPGTYNESIDFKGKGIRLYSSNGQEVTILNGTGSHHVVQCVSSETADTVLEGFTITGGNANGTSFPDNVGGGMYNSGSSPTLTHCTFSDNTATTNGGGIYNSDSSPTVTHCTFSSNTVTYDGGGMYNYYRSRPTVINCTFNRNTANDKGGGMYNWNNSSPMVTYCTFNGNTANNGGGMYNENNLGQSNSPNVTNCIFNDNTATTNGGGIGNTLSSPSVTNCKFSGNTATTNGGGIFNGDSSYTSATNCIFINNSAEWGGGLYNWNNSDSTVTNCTFSDNTAKSTGGGMLNNSGSNPKVTNCILWGNKPNEIVDYDSPQSSTNITYSCVDRAWSGTGNVKGNPLFVDAPGGDFGLSSCSPCVDAGNNAALPAGITTDVADNPRFSDDTLAIDRGTGTPPIVDMGAYERQVSSPAWPIYNQTQGTGYCCIQSAIDVAVDGDEIEVDPGTYPESIDFKGKAIRLYSSGGPEVTTIDGAGHYHVVQCISGEGAGTILEGFTLTGGNANGSSFPDEHGGGMYNFNSSPTVNHCIFRDNSVQASGGGMCNNNSSPIVVNCIFVGNTAAYYGGAVDDSQESIPLFANCIFSRNWAKVHGGAINNNQSSPILTNCTFSGNTVDLSDSAGGILNYDNCHPVVNNCILWGNSPHQIVDWPGTNCLTTVTYSDVQGGWSGNGNINADPRFANPAGSDLRLSNSSPCVDVGNNEAVPSELTADLAGNPRITNGNADGSKVVEMGAYELECRVYNLTKDISYITIQMAIDRADNGDQIEVSAGTYREVVHFKDKSITLRSKNPNDLDVVAATIIDASGLNSSVVIFTGRQGSDTELAGFTITGGSAQNGGGMYCENSSPTVSHCIFSDNKAMYGGGGMFNKFSNPRVSDCVFRGNATDDGRDYEIPRNSPHGYHGGHAGHGGGMYNYYSSPIVRNCEFAENWTGTGGAGEGGSNEGLYQNGGWGGNGGNGGNGAGMYNNNSNPNVIDCRFNRNNTGAGGSAGNGGDPGWSQNDDTDGGDGGNGGNGGDGAGIYNHNSTPVITNCNFIQNHTGIGGMGGLGGNVVEGKDLDIVDGGGNGGRGGNGGSGAGMYNIGSTPNLTNCAFFNNETSCGGNGGYGGRSEVPVSDGGDGGDGGHGAGIYNSDSSPNLTNCTFTLNQTSAGGYGGLGAIFRTDYNIYFEGEDGAKGVEGLGGGIYNGDNSNSTLTNCILWFDRLWDSKPSEIHNVNSITSVTFSNLQDSYPGTGNISYYPMFVDFVNGDLRLLACSPCVDAGNNDSAGQDVTTDLDGNLRFVDDEGVIDTGAGAPPIVDMGAYELQLNTLIWPVYNITRNTPHCGIQLAIEAAEDGDEIEVLTGTYREAIDFLGKSITLRSTNPNEPGVVAATIIDATNSGAPAVTCAGGEGPDTVLAGFTITGGGAQYGGGMGNYKSSPTVTHCIFSGNSAEYGGGMCNLFKSSPTIIHCTFRGNSATEGGGGMSNQFSSSPIVINCAFIGNGAYSTGGGFENFVDSSPTVTNCIFSGNLSDIAGGGMCNFYDCSPTVTNCTFSGNLTGEGGGGLSNLDSSSIVTNSIFWGNLPDGIYNGGTSTPIVTYCDIQSDYSGTGNINADPHFVDIVNPDLSLRNLRLQPDSPCIDSGSNDAPAQPEADYDGYPRIIDSDCNGTEQVDMGAYELYHNIIGNLDYNCRVDFADFSVFGSAWMTQEGDPSWNQACDFSIPPDKVIDLRDLIAFAEHWLTKQQ